MSRATRRRSASTGASCPPSTSPPSSGPTPASPPPRNNVGLGLVPSRGARTVYQSQHRMTVGAVEPAGLLAAPPPTHPAQPVGIAAAQDTTPSPTTPPPASSTPTPPATLPPLTAGPAGTPTATVAVALPSSPRVGLAVSITTLTITGS